MDQSAMSDSMPETGVDQAIRRPLHLYLLLAGLVLLLLWAGLKSWRMYRLGQSLMAHQATAEALMSGGLSNIDPDEAERLVNGLRSDVISIRQESAPFLPLVAALGWLPGYGPTLAAAPHLLEMADAGTEAAAYAVRGLKPALYELQNEERAGSPLPAFIQTLDAARPDLLRSSAAMERVVAARSRIENTDRLHGRIRPLLEQLDVRLPLASDALKLAPVLPGIMGMDGPRTYLVVAQNQDELRATGGYISGAGILTVENGEITDLTFIDANLIGNWREKPFDFPPQPLYELMGLELFLFRDANYWPDFPTSAEQTMNLASYSLDLPPFDGVIAMDQQFVAALVSVTGPIEVEELGVRVTAGNAIDQLRAAWQLGEGEDRVEWLRNRKDFLGPFAAALRSRLESDLGSIDILYLADTLLETLARRQLQLYMRDPAAAATLDELGWDSRLETAAQQDFLMVVDSNFGYNKVNPLIESEITYEVELSAGGEGVADLALSYVHGGAPGTEECFQGREEVYAGGTYEELISGCYFNYLRVYAPAGSELLEATRHTAPASAFLNNRGWDRSAETVFEHPFLTTFANFFMLPEGEDLVTRFQYQLPEVVNTDSGERVYRLNVFRQAGVPVKRLTVRVTLPSGFVPDAVLPETAVIQGQTITFGGELDRDIMFSISYHQE